MTTIVYDKRCKTVAADSKNTDDSGAKWLCNKIEVLADGSVFLGSGHLCTIAQCKNWARHGFDEEYRPDFSFYLEDTAERGFSCLHISKDGKKVILIDGELNPLEVLDPYMGVGSGASYALGAMDAGASVVEAVEIACNRDGNSCLPIQTHTFKEWPRG